MSERKSRALVAAAIAGALTVSGGLGAIVSAQEWTGVECDPSEIRLVGGVRDKANPYYVSWLAGGDAFAESVGLEQTELAYDNDSQVLQSQVRTLLAVGNGPCTILNILPHADTDTPVLVDAADDAGAWLITQWNKPADFRPTDETPTWLSHLTYNDEDFGYGIAKALFEDMGGEGNIVAISGTLGATAGSARDAGLDRALAEYPGITLLDRQVGDFQRDLATTVMNTLVAKHGDDIEGVWVANDDMAVGALNALKAADMDGKVKVVGVDAIPEAIAGVQDGTFAATALADAYWQGGIGLAIGYCVLTGEIDPAAITDEQRNWFAGSAIITADNVDQFAGEPDAAKYVAEDWTCDSLWDNFVAPIP
jgi:ribose transport system substrate-binding protein